VLYLSGRWHKKLEETPMGMVGYLRQPNYSRGISGRLTPEGRYWAADTGIYGNPAFDFDKYLTLLEQWMPNIRTCLFATAPDVVADWEATLDRSLPAIPEIKQLGYPVAVVLQDGATSETVPWSVIDAVFVGGSTKWKLSEAAYSLVAEAKDKGIWAHMGRVNSLRRLRAAQVAGYDSADGTHIRFAPDRGAAQVVNWIRSLENQEVFPLHGIK